MVLWSWTHHIYGPTAQVSFQGVTCGQVQVAVQICCAYFPDEDSEVQSWFCYLRRRVQVLIRFIDAVWDISRKWVVASLRAWDVFMAAFSSICRVTWLHSINVDAADTR